MIGVVAVALTFGSEPSSLSPSGSLSEDATFVDVDAAIVATLTVVGVVTGAALVWVAATVGTVIGTVGISAVTGASVLDGGGRTMAACDVFGRIAPKITNANVIHDAAIDTSHQRYYRFRRRVPGRPAFGTGRTLGPLLWFTTVPNAPTLVRTSKRTATPKTVVRTDERP